MTAAVAATAASLGACGGSSSGAGSDTLTVTLPGDINNFNPYTNQLQTFGPIRASLFDTLVAYDRQMNIVPGVASFKSNATATKFTFELEPGVEFSNGKPLDAKSVVESFRLVTASKGIWAAYIAGVKSYATPNDSTVVMTLDAPNAGFLDGIARIAIVPPSEYKDMRRRPVGSGPFVFDHWTPNREIVLKRNETYWGEKPAYETLIFKPVEDEQVALNSVYSGDADVIYSAATDLVEQADANKVQIIEPEFSNDTAFVEMMGNTGVLDDPKLRQAMAHALDTEAIHKIVYRGRGDLQWSPIPKSSWAYKDVAGYPYDLAKAKQLVDEAGAQGTTVTLEIPAGYPDGQQMARIWQKSLAEVGINLKIRVSALSVWLDKYVKGAYDASWNASTTTADPSTFFSIILSQPQYKPLDLSELTTEAVSTTDKARRTALYGELQEIAVRELPVMMIQSRPHAAIARQGVDGLVMDPLGELRLAGATLGES